MGSNKQLAKGTNIAVRPSEIVEARFNLTAKENNILDFVLSRIENDGIHTYRLQVDDFKNIYKTDTSNIYRDLKKATLSIYNKGFKLTTDKSEAHFHWFSSIEYIEKDGIILCELGQRLKEILLDMKQKIYYKIDYSMNLSSAYSQRIYYYLLRFMDKNKDTGWRIDKVDDLREKLQCPESYKRYAEFKRHVLDVAEKEINEITDLTFAYEQIYTKNKVTSIKFFIERKEKKKETPKQQQDPKLIDMEFINAFKTIGIYSDEFIEMLTLFIHKKVIIKDFNNIIGLVKYDYTLIEHIYIKNKDKIIDLDAVEIVSIFLQYINNSELKKEEEELIEQVRKIITEKLSNEDILKILKAASNDIKLIKSKYEIAKKTPNIKSLVGWLIRAIKDNYKEPITKTGKPKKDKFSDYPQRDYNYEELEKKRQEKLKRDVEKIRREQI